MIMIYGDCSLTEDVSRCCGCFTPRNGSRILNSESTGFLALFQLLFPRKIQGVGPLGGDPLVLAPCGILFPSMSSQTWLKLESVKHPRHFP